MSRLEVTLIGLIAVGGPAFISGCSSAGSSNASSASTATAPRLEDDFVPPAKGETQAQVIAQYDEPDRVLQSSVYGETWFYVFGKGKLFIPFYGPFAKLRFLTIHFDRYGRVIGWESGTNQPY